MVKMCCGLNFPTRDMWLEHLQRQHPDTAQVIEQLDDQVQLAKVDMPKLHHIIEQLEGDLKIADDERDLLAEKLRAERENINSLRELRAEMALKIASLKEQLDTSEGLRGSQSHEIMELKSKLYDLMHGDLSFHSLQRAEDMLVQVVGMIQPIAAGLKDGHWEASIIAADLYAAVDRLSLVARTLNMNNLLHVAARVEEKPHD